MASRLRIAFGLAIIAAVTLMLELLLIRAFDAMMNAEMSHMIITCAMFSFGLSGVYASLRPLPVGTDPERYIAKLAVWFGVFALLLLPLLNLNPFNYSNLTSNMRVEAVYFAVMYVTLMIPFLLSGLIFTTVFSTYASQIRTLYCFDLCGAAIGSVVFVPFVPRLGPGGLLFYTLALSLLAAVLFVGKFGRAQQGLVALALVAAVVPIVHSGYFEFSDHEDKREVMWAKNNGLLEMTRWDPVAKVEVVRPRPKKDYTFIKRKNGDPYELFKHVAYDGGEQSSRLYHFDGDLVRMRADLEKNPKLFVNNFWNRSVAASHWLRADQQSDVAIIGSAAGQETKAALLYNPRSVEAVEMVSAVVQLATHEYSDYIGNIFKDPRVHLHVGEGRTFLRSANKSFDIIQIFSNHTSSSMAAGGGAGRGVLLQTVEAYGEYFSRLKPDGILQINSHIYPRLVATAARAWKLSGRSDFRKHVIVYERPGMDMIPLLLFKMSPWTAEEVDKLNGFMLRPSGRGNRDTFHLVEDPLHPEQSVLSNDFYTGSLPPELVERVPYRITPPTDDRPYFNFLRKKLRAEQVDPNNFVSVSIADALNSQMSDKGKYGALPLGIPLDLAHFIVSGAVGLLFAILFVVVPLFFAASGRKRWAGEFTSLFYFSCLGIGFIIIELTLVPIFIKLIGVPLYTYSAVIFTMLAAAGIGSNAANALKISANHRWWVPYVGTVALGALLLLTYRAVFEQFLATPIALRIIVAAIMIFPLSFFMGMCFPLGILAIENKPRGAIAWAWGMNGLFTTIGGLGAALLSMFWGLRFTLLVAFGIYVLAGLAFNRLRRFAETSNAETESPSVATELESAQSGIAGA
jgi:spermidine synthase